MKIDFGKVVVTVFIFGLGIGVAFAAGTAWGAVSGNASTAAAPRATPGTGIPAKSGTEQVESGLAGESSRPAASGTVEKVEGNVLTVTTRSGPVKVNIKQDTAISTMKRGTTEDLKAGERVTVSGEKQNDGSIAATSIQILPARSAEGTPTATPGGRGEQREKKGG